MSRPVISTRCNFLFVHIPKTGGNSVQTVLKEYSDDVVVTPLAGQDGVDRFELHNAQYPFSKHTPLWIYKQHLPQPVYSSLYTFATIRNPWDLMVSWYFSPHRGVRDWNRDAFLKLIDKVRRARWFLRESEPGSPMLTEPRDNLPAHWRLNYVMRFESLQTDFNRVCNAVGIDRTVLPVRNRSHRSGYRSYYDRELREKVESKFSEEINFGGYEF